MTSSRYTIVLYAFILIFDCMMPLKLLELRVPAHVKLGSQPELSCRWELGPQDVLYSIKWYKDGQEFFRHVPRDPEPHRKFNLPGVEVNRSDELASNITLSPATLETEGRYRCEVSGERPLFPTVSEHTNMIVVVLPEYGPVISGFRPNYQIGDQLSVNCTSGPSRPAIQLTWYVNGEPAPFSAMTSPEVNRDLDSYETTSLALSFEINKRHFVNGGLKIKCLATLASIYWRSNEECAREVKSGTHELVEAKSYNAIRTIELLPSNRSHSYKFSSPDVFINFLIKITLFVFIVT